jgi:hypothetical protein
MVRTFFQTRYERRHGIRQKCRPSGMLGELAALYMATGGTLVF